MGLNTIFGAVFLLMLLTSVAGTKSKKPAGGARPRVFNVGQYGAKCDDRSDNAKAFMSAWREACASPTRSAIVIPKGTFVVGPVTFNGPCKAPIEIRLRGIVKAPADLNKFQGMDGWIAFNHVDRMKLSGSGTFDGQGHVAWAQNNCGQNSKCRQLPISIRYNFITNSIVHGITSLNSKNFHMNVLGCRNLTFDHVKVIAPENSINTDGIHIGRSSQINVIDSNIGTGDDCVSIGEGSQQIHITRVNCGPGHGISVGSLGKYPDEAPVVGIFVKNTNITGTSNGIRIKTWPASPVSIARDMHFENIIMHDVSNPILIDQGYCPYNQCKAQVPSKVKISNVSFKNIRGTSSTPNGVTLTCSRACPCQNVEIGNIDLKFNGGRATSLCANVKPRFSGNQQQRICV